VAFAWLVMAVLIALGGAGIATSLNHPPESGARPELTWTGDQLAGAALDAAAVKLQALSDAVDALSDSSKDALANLVAGNTAGLAATLGKGSVQLGVVSTAASELAEALAAVPFTDAQGALHVSSSTLARYQDLAATPALTRNLESDWAVLSARSMAASAVPDLLAQHDQQTAAAAKEGEAGHYKQALALLDAPDATIARARQLADTLSKIADVSTLNQWIALQAAYDSALRQLYQAMLASNGRVTSAVHVAFTAEEAAKAALPISTKGIVVIMGDIARGGLNQAVIDIEVARGSLAEALAAQQASPGSSPGTVSSGGSPVVSPGTSGAAPPAGSGTPVASTSPAGSSTPSSPASSAGATPSRPGVTPPP
jgi:hypothetical protein